MIWHGLCPLLAGLALAGCRAPEPIVTASLSASIEGENGLPPEVIAQCRAATVLIGDCEGSKLGSMGSKLVLSDGRTVVTNRHVMAADADAQETVPAWSFGFPDGMEIRRSEDKLPSPTIPSLRIERVERRVGRLSMLQLGGPVICGDFLDPPDR